MSGGASFVDAPSFVFQHAGEIPGGVLVRHETAVDLKGDGIAAQTALAKSLRLSFGKHGFALMNIRDHVAGDEIYS